jgi:glycosyltransferase involved in cell wall biosynthesis
MIVSTELSIIVPTWHNLNLLELCLQSVAAHSELAPQVVVHVNDGSDGTLNWVRDNGIEHTYSPHNIGICRALNAAFEKCRGEYIVYLNDDMFVLPGWDRELYAAADVTGASEPAYVSGTMIQMSLMAPSVILGDYGLDAEVFDQERLLHDFRLGHLGAADWNGATWPPSCIHRKWWKQIGGYSEELCPGFYSDIDFSLKLWQIGCRRFHGVGRSLVYHFGEKTTSLVRGTASSNVRRARIQFLQKWGVLPSTFTKYYLRAGEPFQGVTPESNLPDNRLERLRLAAISSYHRLSGAA